MANSRLLPHFLPFGSSLAISNYRRHIAAPSNGCAYLRAPRCGRIMTSDRALCAARHRSASPKSRPRRHTICALGPQSADRSVTPSRTL
jgi:hypothetical protein